MSRVEELLKPFADNSQCLACHGTGRNPMSDNVNWLPCATCHGRTMDIRLEYAPRCAWHMDCAVLHCAPMKWLTGFCEIEDGSRLQEFECTACGEHGFAGVDAHRRCVSRAALSGGPPAQEAR